MLSCRRGVPISQALTLAANRSEQRDSPTEEGSGEIFTNISVFESPPRQGWLHEIKENQIWCRQESDRTTDIVVNIAIML